MKTPFNTTGPFGLPMKDKQAKALGAILRDLPGAGDLVLQRLVSTRGLSELSPESRCDVSWITVETPDHAGDLVLASGMDDSIYRLNPIVTLNHRYDQPPVGRSLWRRRVREGALVGVKAKTYYLPRPKSWPTDDWLADQAFELVKVGLLNGKSIGFLPLQLRAPTSEEIAKYPQLEKVRHVITRWLLLEYACCYLPMQPFALVEQVDKTEAGFRPGEAHDDMRISRKRLENMLIDHSMSHIRTCGRRDKLVRLLSDKARSQRLEKIIGASVQRTFQFRRGIV